MATEAAWLNGEKVRKTHVGSKTLLTGIGLLMEGTKLLDFYANVGELSEVLIERGYR